MKKSRLITSSLLAVFVIALGAVLFTSSTTVEQSNSKALTELSAELADMKKEITSRRMTEGNNAVSSEPFLGEVILFAGNFAPRGWAFCEGQLVAIAQNSALFSILGTTYGGDGRTTFGLPDLRGRSPIGVGTGPGLSNIKHGQKAGMENNTLQNANLPAIKVPGFEMHPKETDHQYIEGAKSFITVGNVANTQVNASQRGGGKSFSNRDPYLGMHYIIATQGTFPSRN